MVFLINILIRAKKYIKKLLSSLIRSTVFHVFAFIVFAIVAYYIFMFTVSTIALLFFINTPMTLGMPKIYFNPLRPEGGYYYFETDEICFKVPENYFGGRPVPNKHISNIAFIIPWNAIENSGNQENKNTYLSFTIGKTIKKPEESTIDQIGQFKYEEIYSKNGLQSIINYDNYGRDLHIYFNERKIYAKYFCDKVQKIKKTCRVHFWYKNLSGIYYIEEKYTKLYRETYTRIINEIESFHQQCGVNK